MLPGTGVLLVGHGSREPVGVTEFLDTARLVAQRAGQAVVEPCFLEFARPTIDEGYCRLIERGARRVVVVPALLFAAGHGRRDIPAAVAAVAAKNLAVSVQQVACLGCHEAILELSKLRYEWTLSGRPHVPYERTALILVGRGSHDPEATSEMLEFVRLRHELTPAAHARVAFLAMAEPALDAVLDNVARFDVSRVVVQPHLLFGGVFVRRVEEMVHTCRQRLPQIEWLLSGHLGPADLLAAALVDRAASAAAAASC